MGINKRISLDYETYSAVSIKTVGAHRYIEDPSFEILCLAYSIDGGPSTLWLPSYEPDKALVEALNDEEYIIEAYNAIFEYLVTKRCWRKIGLSGFPKLKRYKDTMAISCSHSYPRALKDVAAVFEGEQKDKRGQYLLNKLTKPKKASKATPFTRWTPKNNPGEFDELYQYCLQDVRTEQSVLRSMPRPHLSDFEQKVWQHTMLQNNRGIYIDKPLVEAILRVQAEWKKEKQRQLCTFTHGEVTTGGQRDRIIAWCKSKGYPLKNLTADTVNNTLADPEAPEEVKRMMGFRKMLSKTSTAKFEKMIKMICKDGTVKGNLFYWGAITGRYGGRGLQIQNLPRRKEKDPTQLIEAFKSGLPAVIEQFGDNVMELASKLIRPCLISPEGKDLYVSDYSSVENRFLHWAAGDEDTLHEFAQGLDQYKTFASARFNVSYDEVTDEQRFHGKTAILGLGYQMGAKTYKATVEGYGGNISIDHAQETVNIYRDKYEKVKILWYKLYAAAMEAVERGTATQYGVARFGVKNDRLYMILPSGRLLTYNNPETEMRLMPWGQNKKVITFMGINPYSGKWGRLAISPGRLVENLVQAGTRDILVQGLINVEEAGYPVVGSVHDEGISYAPEGYGSIEEYNQLMCQMPRWADGLPLAATGYIGKRYKKD